MQSSSLGIEKLTAALVRAQAEIRSVAKDGRNPDFNSKYTTLDAIMEHVRPILAKHELAIAQGEDPARSGGIIVAMETVLLHASGQWIANVVTVPLKGRRLRGTAQFGEADAQSAGAALTYARRYGVSALLGLASDDDDDANSVTPKPPGAATVRAPTRYPSRTAGGSVPQQAAGVPQGAISSDRVPLDASEQDVSPPAASRAPTQCPKCASYAIIDVRAQKRTPQSPDFRCQGCGSGIWRTRRPKVAGQAVASGPPDDAPPPDEPPPDLFP